MIGFYKSTNILEKKTVQILPDSRQNIPTGRTPRLTRELIPFPAYKRFLTPLQQTTFEIIVAKG